MEDRKGCRIYKDIYGKWELLWYIPGKNCPEVKPGKDKDQLIRFAKKNSFDFYFDGTTNNKIDL